VTKVYQQKGLDYFDLVKKTLREQLSMSTRFGGFFEVPVDSYNRLRRQYDPKQLIRAMIDLNGSDSDYRLGIVDVDIYVRDMNFIFGIANPLLRSAIVSLFRLNGPRLEERVAKEVVHENGHLLGLEHCSSPLCVMHFSNTIDDTDKKNMSLCIQCRRKLEV
jgi:archaemetzincin